MIRRRLPKATDITGQSSGHPKSVQGRGPEYERAISDDPKPFLGHAEQEVWSRIHVVPLKRRVSSHNLQDIKRMQCQDSSSIQCILPDACFRYVKSSYRHSSKNPLFSFWLDPSAHQCINLRLLDSYSGDSLRRICIHRPYRRYWAVSA